jgi:NADH:ubiquinone reductase (H+-translocating)
MICDEKIKVVIVGAGFGGLNAAKILARNNNLHVVVIDQKNHHLFQPLLYQVATAGLSPAEIAVPIRAVLGRYKNCETYLAKATKVDLNEKILHTDFRPFSFDYLILACGAQHSYFGHDEWETHAPGLKTLEQAREIRRRIFLAFELAEREENKIKQEALLTFVVVGAGPTGVELAGTIGEISHFALNREFRHIDPRTTKVILLEGGSRILPSFSKKNADRATIYLASLGVDVWTHHLVTNITEDGVSIGDKYISAKTVLWAAGVKPGRINHALGVPLDSCGRVIVLPDLSLNGHKNIFALGDMAHCIDENNKPLPGVAAVAIQQGHHCAQNILADLRGQKRKPFKYLNKGQMATVGRSKAIMEYKSWQIGGLLAWIGWLFVHIYYLIGFKNRILVMIQWAFSFITYRRGARLIQSKDWQSHE